MTPIPRGAPTCRRIGVLEEDGRACKCAGKRALFLTAVAAGATLIVLLMGMYMGLALHTQITLGVKLDMGLELVLEASVSMQLRVQCLQG